MRGGISLADLLRALRAPPRRKPDDFRGDDVASRSGVLALDRWKYVRSAQPLCARVADDPRRPATLLWCSGGGMVAGRGCCRAELYRGAHRVLRPGGASGRASLVGLLRFRHASRACALFQRACAHCPALARHRGRGALRGEGQPWLALGFRADVGCGSFCEAAGGPDCGGDLRLRRRSGDLYRFASRETERRAHRAAGRRTVCCAGGRALSDRVWALERFQDLVS